MGLWEKARKLFLKLGLTYLPWIALGTAAAYGIRGPAQPVPVYEKAEDKNKSIDALADYCRKGLLLTGALAGIFLIGAYGAYRARKRRVVLEGHKGIDKIFDNPGILSAASAIATLGAFTAVKCQGNEDILQGFSQKYPLLFSAWMASAGTILSSTFYSLYDMVSKFKSPCVKNTLKTAFLSFSNPEQREKKSLELIAVESDDTLAARAKVALNNGMPLDALYNYNACLQFRNRRSEVEECLATNWIYGLARKGSTAVALRENSKLLEKDPSNMGLLTDREYHLLLGGREKEAKQVAEKILAMPNCTDEDRILQSFVLDSLSENELAGQIRDKLFSRIIKDNSMMKIGKGLLYAKKGKMERLHDESWLLKHLQKYSEKYDFEAARPLKVICSEQNAWLFETFSDGKGVYGLLESNPDFEVLRKCAITQARLHAVAPAVGSRGIEADISSFIDKMPWDFNRSELYNSFQDLLFPIWPYQAADCDGHRENRHYNTAGQITVYDLEPRGNAPVAFDYAKLFRQGRWVGSWEKQKELLTECAEEYNRHSEKKISSQVFAEHVLRASPYKALRFASFVWKKPERHDTALSFLGNAENDLEILSSIGSIYPGVYSSVSCAIEDAKEKLITAAGRIPPSSFH